MPARALAQYQRSRAGEKRDMAVVFFVDPALVQDSEQTGLDTITLSYTMYPVRQPESGAPGGKPVPRYDFLAKRHRGILDELFRGGNLICETM